MSSNFNSKLQPRGVNRFQTIHEKMMRKQTSKENETVIGKHFDTRDSDVSINSFEPKTIEEEDDLDHIQGYQRNSSDIIMQAYPMQNMQSKRDTHQIPNYLLTNEDQHLNLNQMMAAPLSSPKSHRGDDLNETHDILDSNEEINLKKESLYSSKDQPTFEVINTQASKKSQTGQSVANKSKILSLFTSYKIGSMFKKSENQSSKNKANFKDTIKSKSEIKYNQENNHKNQTNSLFKKKSQVNSKSSHKPSFQDQIDERYENDSDQNSNQQDDSDFTIDQILLILTIFSFQNLFCILDFNKYA